MTRLDEVLRRVEATAKHNPLLKRAAVAVGAPRALGVARSRSRRARGEREHENNFLVCEIGYRVFDMAGTGPMSRSDFSESAGLNFVFHV